MDNLKLINLTPDILCISKFEGKFTFTNPAFENVLGYNTDEVSNINVFSIIHPDDLEKVRNAIKTARNESSDTLKLEYRYLCKNGNYKWIAWNVKISWDEELVYGAGHDVTERKNMEIELIKSREEVYNATKAKSLFLANIIHEIRTPMNDILATIQILQSMTLGDEQNKYINMLKESGNTLFAIINDLLDTSKIESGSFKLDNEPFCLKDTVNNIYNNLLVTGNAKGLEVSYYLDPRIDFQVIGDELRLKQILTNLVSNAVKYTDEGLISFKVTMLSCDENTSKIEFRIKDTGIGIEDSFKEGLFQNFNQGGLPVGKKYSGTGLGLAISKQLAALMNGDIYFESTYRQGSIFTFICELKKLNDKDLFVPQAHIIGEKSQVINLNSNKVILCVEDNLISQEVMQSIVERKGYKYIAAYNGNEALDILENNKIDLILMDVQLPELNGLETTKIIRAREADKMYIPIIAMTAYAMAEDKEKCLQAGMDMFISKPFEIEELYRTFEHYLRE